MAYIKPQYPLKSGENYIYPPTTADQVIISDGKRLSGVGVYLDKPDEGEETTVVGLNADTLGGIAANEYVLQDDLTTNLKALILDFAHPVGSYYWSRESTDPSVLFGGEWKPVKDKFILAAGDNYSVDDSGGEAEHTLTVDEMPVHNHKIYMNSPGTNSGHWGEGDAVQQNGDLNNSTGNTGGNQPHNNMPPYLVAYCWYRTA